MEQQNKWGTILSYITVLLHTLTGIVLTGIIIRLLGNSQYGLYSIVSGLSSNMSILSLGLGTAVVRYVSECRLTQNKDKERQIVGTVCMIFTMLGLIAILVSAIIYRYFDIIYANSLSENELAQGKFMFIFASIDVVASLIDVPFSSCILAYEKYILSRLEIIAKFLMRLIITVPFVLMNESSTSIIILDMVITLSVLFFNIFYCSTRLQLGATFKIHDFKLIKTIFQYSFFVFLILITDELNKNVDQTLIGIKLTATALTVFMAGRKVSSMFDSISNAISNMFLPKATALVIENASMERVQEFIVKMGRLQSFVTFYVFISFWIFGADFMWLWLGDGYRQSWITAVIIMSGTVCPLLKSSIKSYVQALNRQKFISIIYLINAILNAVLTWFSLDCLGIIGAAVCSAVTSILCNEIILNIYFYKKLGLNIFLIYKKIFSGIWIAILLSVLSGLIIQLAIQHYTWFVFLIVAILFTTIYTLLCYWVGMNINEKRSFISILNKKVN